MGPVIHSGQDMAMDIGLQPDILESEPVAASVT